MLCDDMAALDQETTETLAGAQRFFLKRDAVAAAVNVSLTKPSSLVRGIGLCKLPYPRCWLEWSAADQMDASGRSGHRGRIGALLHAGDDGLDVGLADLIFWAPGRPSPTVWAPAYSFDYRPVFAKPQRRSVESVSFGNYDLTDQAAMRELFRRHPPEPALDTAAMTMSAANQALTIMSFLMLLNSRNSVEISGADVSRLNKARSKARKSPYYTYRVVDLAFTKIQQNRLAAAGLSDAARRAHLVRGHFKVRSTGIFWWMPHLRGDLNVGFADKDYGVRQ
jgi:hypothetical protein